MIRSSFFYIGLFSFLISIFSFFNIIYSYYFNLYLNLDSYIYSLIISLFFGFLFTFKKKSGLKISIYEKIIIVLMGYLLLPLFIATPYYLSIYNISFLDAYFEAISGFTSTGFTIFNNIKHLDESVLTIGSFDGMHRGHMQIINKLKQISQDKGIVKRKKFRLRWWK